FVSFYSSFAHRPLHSFPTRRSSDLTFRHGGWYAPNGSAAIEDRNGDGRPDLIVVRRDDEDGVENSATLILNDTAPNRPPLTSAADRKSTRLNSSHDQISYAVFCLKK